MDKLKQWIALAVLASVAVLAAGWFLLVSPKRGEAADLRLQAQEQLATNRTLAGELEVLKAQARDLPQKQAELASVEAKIPDNPALPGLIRQLMEAADAADVQLVSIAPGEPVLRAPPAPAAPAAPEAGAAQVGGGAAPVDPAAPAPVGAAGTLAEIPLAVNVVGDYYGVQRFLAEAEELSRAVLVENLTLAPGASPTAGENADKAAVERGKSLSATINGFVYMAANRPAPTTVAAPVAATAETAE